MKAKQRIPLSVAINGGIITLILHSDNYPLKIKVGGDCLSCSFNGNYSTN